MPYWVQLLLSLAAFALLLALVAAVWALRRTAQRAEAVLTILEQELRPLTGQAHALTEDLRMLTREAGRELERVGAVTDRVDDIATGPSRFVTTLTSLGRAGEWLDKSRELFEEQTQRLMSAFEAGRDAMREEIRRGSSQSNG